MKVGQKVEGGEREEVQTIGWNGRMSTFDILTFFSVLVCVYSIHIIVYLFYIHSFFFFALLLFFSSCRLFMQSAVVDKTKTIEFIIM